MYAKLFENHLSYIRYFSQFAQKYQCKTCERHFKQAGDLHRHQKSCSNKTKFMYPGGGFHQDRESIFEKLDQYEIHVLEDIRTFPWLICYYFEVLLRKIQDQATDMLQWTHKHVPVSVSICSNVEGHTDPICIVDYNQDQLVEKMVSQINDIALEVYKLAREMWGWVLGAINDKIREQEEEYLDWMYEDDDEDEVEDEAIQDGLRNKIAFTST